MTSRQIRAAINRVLQNDPQLMDAALEASPREQRCMDWLEDSLRGQEPTVENLWAVVMAATPPARTYADLSHDDFVELILREMADHSLVYLLKVPGAWAGRDVQHEKNDDGYPQEGREEDQDPAEDVGGHQEKKGSRVQGFEGSRGSAMVAFTRTLDPSTPGPLPFIFPARRSSCGWTPWDAA